jgi:hypothetical protein
VKIFAALCLALTAAGCASRIPPRPSAVGAAEDYYPLAVGNHWTYEVNFLGDRRERRVEIIAHRDGYYIDNEGAQLTVDGLGVRDQKRYLLRDPIEVGGAWMNVVSPSSIEHYKITQCGAPCRVPAGAFENCVRVESRNRMDEQRTLVNELTFAPSVGIVRIELTLESGGKRVPQSTFELKEFALGARAPPSPSKP